MAPIMALAETPSFSLVWERSYPLLCGLAAAGGVLVFWPGGYLFAEAKHWELKVLFDAGFDFSAVATSFLFTFYTFVITAERGFIAKMRRSIYFEMLVEYTMKALALGAFLAAASLFMEVVNPTPVEKWDTACFLWAGWTFISVWTIAAFVRTTLVFIGFASVDN